MELCLHPERIIGAPASAQTAVLPRETLWSWPTLRVVSLLPNAAPLSPSAPCPPSPRGKDRHLSPVTRHPLLRQSLREVKRNREERPLPQTALAPPVSPGAAGSRRDPGEGGLWPPHSRRSADTYCARPRPGRSVPGLGVCPSVLPLPAHSPLPQEWSLRPGPGMVSQDSLHRRALACGAVFLSGFPVSPC